MIGLLRLQCADGVFYCCCYLVIREGEQSTGECVRECAYKGGWMEERGEWEGGRGREEESESMKRRDNARESEREKERASERESERESGRERERVRAR